MYKILAFAVLALALQPQPVPFRIEETTIARIHAAMRAGQLSCRELVQQYLRRIEAYDKNGPELNSIVVLNPDALKEADEMDRQEILSKYTVVPDAAGLIEAFLPLVSEVGADVISIQVASVDPKRTIDLLGAEVLPELRSTA